MAASFFWYDLETSGIDPKDARIMQFAGQRTDMDLQLVGEPVNILIRMTDDVIPDPDAVMLTGITPQATIADGVTEADFLTTFMESIAMPDTIFVGYNSIHFDDEFMRYLLYRNFYDPYEWQWRDGRSRWDLLDVIRMTRALRPGGINWPTDKNGKSTNRLELLTVENGLEHTNAHDALSDVMACIHLARLIREKQPKLFGYLLDLRDKSKVAAVITGGEPFVYTNGSYSSTYEKTTVAVKVVGSAKDREALVYDLRQDPTKYKNMNAAQLAEAWRYKKEEDPAKRLPVQSIAFNRCPAVAPVGVLDLETQSRLGIDLKVIEHHLAILRGMTDFPDTLRAANELLSKSRDNRETSDPDAQLYDGFVDGSDRTKLPEVRASAQKGEPFTGLQDKRLQALLPRYIARNFPSLLSTEQREAWEAFRTDRLIGGGENSRVARFVRRLQTLAGQKQLTKEQRYLLEELQLYAESIMPEVL